MLSVNPNSLEPLYTINICGVVEASKYQTPEGCITAKFSCTIWQYMTKKNPVNGCVCSVSFCPGTCKSFGSLFPVHWLSNPINKNKI